jgi:hypothetical protein
MRSARLDPLPGIVLFGGAALLAFFLLPRAALAVHTRTPSLLVDLGCQGTLAIIAAGCLTQFLVVRRATSLFTLVMGPALVATGAAPFFWYFAGFGIIHVTWSLIFAGSIAGFMFVTAVFESLTPVIESAKRLDERQKDERLTYVREELNRFLKLATTAYTALAASIGVSMTILFREGALAWGDFETLVRALGMTLGFASVSLGLLLWVIKPYLDTFLDVRDLYDQRLVRLRVR